MKWFFKIIEYQNHGFLVFFFLKLYIELGWEGSMLLFQTSPFKAQPPERKVCICSLSWLATALLSCYQFSLRFYYYTHLLTLLFIYTSIDYYSTLICCVSGNVLVIGNISVKTTSGVPGPLDFVSSRRWKVRKTPINRDTNKGRG